MSTQGRIFAIERYAIHDGPGIRTTVFCKGCPLECVWCHNPESIESQPQVKYVEYRCRACGRCASACPRQCHHIDAAGRHVVTRAQCAQCGTCAAACPGHALEVVGKTVSVDEVMSVVVRDAKYYVKSGGGLTLSGGEPLLQPAFARELLAEAKKHGIHTCLDTTGYCRTADLLSLWDLVDLFLYDYKETDPKRHREYTGVDNGLILEHLARINSHGKSIVLRCPIIPGRNDRQDHFERIAEISRELTNIVEINVLPFHPFAQSKSAQVGREYRCADTPAVSRAVADAWVRDLQARVRVPVRHG